MSAPAVVGSVGDTRRPLPSKAEALARHAVNTQPSLSDSIEMAAQIFREIDDDTEAEDELDHEDEESGQEEADEDEDDVVFGAAGGNLLNLDADAWDDTALIQLWDQHVRMYKVSTLTTHTSHCTVHYTHLRPATHISPLLLCSCIRRRTVN